jgi:hypothetical protein
MVDQSLLPLSDDLRYVICSRATLSSVASSQKVDPSCSVLVGCLGVCFTDVFFMRMSCDGPVTAGRPPALVRLTLGACVPSFVQVLCL